MSRDYCTNLCPCRADPHAACKLCAALDDADRCWYYLCGGVLRDGWRWLTRRPSPRREAIGEVFMSWLRGKLASFSIGLLLGFLLHEFAAPVIVNYFTIHVLQRPAIEVKGVLPVLVHDEKGAPPTAEDPAPLRWFTYKLVFVLKLRNTGPSPARVGVGQISGCASFPQ
jgi:hypothetical protein